jgi:hypothetical protein
MRKLTVTLIALAAILLAGLLAFKADAQTSRGAANMPAQTQNFTPIEKAACGPFFGARCGPFHHWVCGPYGRRCWCARC